MRAEKEYYIVSNKWTEGYVRTFWRPESKGYTINLDEAGKYTEEQARSDDPKFCPIIATREQFVNEAGKYDQFYVPVDSVAAILGKEMRCIMN